MKLFKMGKKCKDKASIWHMVGEMVKRQSSARLYNLCNYFWTLYFLGEIWLVKLKSFYTSACLKLNYGTIKQKPKMKGCNDDRIYPILS